LAALDWAIWCLNLAEVTENPVRRQAYCRQAREKRDKVSRYVLLMKAHEPERFEIRAKLNEVEAKLSRIYGPVQQMASLPLTRRAQTRKGI